MASSYLFDTHALIFWHLKVGVSDAFINFFNEQADKGELLVSSASFWETAFLVKKGRIAIEDVGKWKDELIENTGISIVDPNADEMIVSVNLPDIHKDPFDRLLVAQANGRDANLVTKDENIGKYDVKVFWM